MLIIEPKFSTQLAEAAYILVSEDISISFDSEKNMIQVPIPADNKLRLSYVLCSLREHVDHPETLKLKYNDNEIDMFGQLIK